MMGSITQKGKNVVDYYVCPTCKTKNEDYVKYCKRCGTWLLSETFPAKKVSKKKGTRFGYWLLGVIAALIIFGIYGMLPDAPAADIPATGSQSEPNKPITRIGMSRSNAIPIGQELVGELEQYNLIGAAEKEKFDIGLTVIETIRGTEAWNIIKAANQFNRKPDEGNEYLLAKIKVRVISSEHDDVQFSVNNQTFTLVSASGADYSSRVLVIDDPINAHLYAGAEAEGWAVFQMKKNDPSPLITVARDPRGRGGVWFKTS